MRTALLVKAGADVNAKNAAQVTALHGAAHKNFIEGIQILVDNGADLSAVSQRRKLPAAPLDWAIGARTGGSSTIYRTEAVALLDKLMDERHHREDGLPQQHERG